MAPTDLLKSLNISKIPPYSIQIIELSNTLSKKTIDPQISSPNTVLRFSILYFLNYNFLVSFFW